MNSPMPPHEHARWRTSYNDLMNAADVVVVGGGVIGLTTAYYLARAGADVVLLDRGDLGQEASWAGAGILPPSNPEAASTPFDRLRAISLAQFPALSRELADATGIDNGYWQCGGVVFNGPPDASPEEWGGAGVARERIAAGDLKALEPGASALLGDAWHLRGMAQVRNPRHLKALIAACKKRGVRLFPHQDVCRLQFAGDTVTGVAAKEATFHAAKVLVAAGAWSDDLLSQAGWRPRIHPVRGQIALLRSEPACLRKILTWGASYVVPRPDGLVLVGSTEEYVGFDRRTTAQAIADLLELAQKLSPPLAHAAVERCWAGLRPATPDGLPYLGPIPAISGLYIAAGHFRAGIQLSAATAQLMTDLLQGRSSPLSLDAFAPARAGSQRSTSLEPGAGTPV
jgi:glycine oxidase